jgi:hypothetical protein
MANGIHPHGIERGVDGMAEAARFSMSTRVDTIGAPFLLKRRPRSTRCAARRSVFQRVSRNHRQLKGQAQAEIILIAIG